MEIAPSGAVIRIESTWAFSSHLGLVAQLLILKIVTSNDAKEKLTLFSTHRQGENFSSHGFPLWFVELPRVVEEDWTDGGLVCNMIVMAMVTAMCTKHFPTGQTTFYKTYLNSRLGKPGEGHEDLLLLVEVAPGHGEDDAEHPEDQGGGEDGQTLPC